MEAANLALQAEARSLHKIKLEALAAENEARLKEAQDEHAALCVRLAAEHEEATVVAEKEFGELRAFLAQHNDALVEEARKRHAEACALALADFEVRCRELRAAHELEMARVRAHNEAIWPQVQMARLAMAELGRVLAFAEHIKFCANKMALGVNYMPNTPCYDRVVEMQALTEALQKAYPDFPDPATYPWPDHENKLAPGTGWVEAPKAKELDIRDPAIDIIKLAKGQRSRPASARPASAARSETPQPLPSGAMHETQLRPMSAAPMRPLSAGRSRFGSVAAAAAASAAAAAAAAASGSPPATARATHRLSGGGAAPPSPGDFASGGFNVRSPQPTSRPGTAASILAATAPVSLAASPRPKSAHAPSPKVRALSASPTLAATAAPSMADPANRPKSSTALTARGSGPASNAPLPRPASARPYVAARMTADLHSLQATVQRYKSPKAFLAPSAASSPTRSKSGPLANKGSMGALQPCFRNDFPKLSYPAVDVRALDM